VKAGIRFKDGDKLDVYLDKIVNATEKGKNKYLDLAKNETKKAIVRHMPKSKKPRRNVRMINDVYAGKQEDKEYGGKRAIVRGKQTTGRLWHLVNDGGWKNRQPTHFMDKAISDVDAMRDSLIDKALKGVGE